MKRSLTCIVSLILAFSLLLAPITVSASEGISGIRTSGYYIDDREEVVGSWTLVERTEYDIAHARTKEVQEIVSYTIGAKKLSTTISLVAEGTPVQGVEFYIPASRNSPGATINVYRLQKPTAPFVYKHECMFDSDSSTSGILNGVFFIKNSEPVLQSDLYLCDYPLSSQSPIIWPDSIQFSDVAGHPLEEALLMAAQSGIMSGDGRGHANPDKLLTRAELVTLAYNVVGKPAAEATVTFSDVSSSAWHYQAVSWAASIGIVQGIGGGKFAPEAPITRQDFAVIIHNITTKYLHLDAPISRYQTPIADYSLISDYAKAAARSAVDTRLITLEYKLQEAMNGYPFNWLDVEFYSSNDLSFAFYFRPKDSVPRADAIYTFVALKTMADALDGYPSRST